MIQRIQSLFLLLSSASFWTIFGFPFASSDEPTSAFLSDKIYNLNDHILILILTILGGLLALLTIFLYKNRSLQIRLSYFTLVLAIVLPFTVILLFYSEATKNFLNAHIEDGLGIYLPIIAIVSTILAIRFIKKDQKIVKSMDRLR
jgi:Na+-transporting NADH:ubiquinone oxidoreductase subunit NqrE